jgi:predicted nucleic acid-binding protein
LINMKKEQVKEILDRVLTWPPERQVDAAQVLTLMEEQDKNSLRLTDEQIAEVKRRLADPNPKFLTLDEVRERFARHRV